MPASAYRIKRGWIEGRGQGWWWHCISHPGFDLQGAVNPSYSPEGPFLTKKIAVDHLRWTIRAVAISRRHGRWPDESRWWKKFSPIREPGRRVMKPIWIDRE